MFLGLDAFSGLLAMTPSYSIGTDMTNLTLNQGNYNKLYVTADPTEDTDNLDDWTYSTKINANYIDTLEGGNSAFSLRNTDSIIIKVREKGTMDWQTIDVVPIEKIEDFDFISEYDFAGNGIDYEFMLISALEGRENAWEYTEITAKFDGICLVDSDNFYSTFLKYQPMTITQNIANSVLPLLNNTYPVVVSSGDQNYSSGNITAMFMQFDEGCQPITGIAAQRYRQQLMNWLVNKKAKILKLADGTVKMIQVTGTPSIQDGDHPELKNISFDWVEIGDVTSEKDMYKNLLSDIEPNKY